MTPLRRRPGVHPRLLLTGALLLAVAEASSAQIRASERSTLSQTIDGTVLTLDYARPRLRGRSPVFGKVVKWDEVWTPGANWATTLEVSKPIELEGRAVPKGKYSVWLVVRKSGTWTLVLDPDHHRFHENPPDSNATQIRLHVVPGPSPATEVLTWSFPDIRVAGGTLAMHWDKSVVSLDLRVSPSFSIAISQEDAAPYLGRYSFAWVPRPGEKPDTSELVLTWEKGSIYGKFIPKDNYFDGFVMIRLADGSLIPGLFDKGEIYEVIRDMVFEFKGPKARPDHYEVRDDHDELMATGSRKP